MMLFENLLNLRRKVGRGKDVVENDVNIERASELTLEEEINENLEELEQIYADAQAEEDAEKAWGVIQHWKKIKEKQDIRKLAEKFRRQALDVAVDPEHNASIRNAISEADNDGDSTRNLQGDEINVLLDAKAAAVDINRMQRVSKNTVEYNIGRNPADLEAFDAIANMAKDDEFQSLEEKAFHTHKDYDVDADELQIIEDTAEKISASTSRPVRRGNAIVQPIVVAVAGLDLGDIEDELKNATDTRKEHPGAGDGHKLWILEDPESHLDAEAGIKTRNHIADVQPVINLDIPENNDDPDEDEVRIPESTIEKANSNPTLQNMNEVADSQLLLYINNNKSYDKDEAQKFDDKKGNLRRIAGEDVFGANHTDFGEGTPSVESIGDPSKEEVITELCAEEVELCFKDVPRTIVPQLKFLSASDAPAVKIRKHKWKVAFDEYDRNRDGCIDKDEFSCVIEKILGKKASKTQIDRIFEKIDLDNNSFIEYDEFAHFMEKR
uniref:EF-hand domain-containing protein n=1 Tax=Aplanochytrium stocchinoi TaxID=215587 RepID=A0A7S3UY19_9STRA|mmetsp:Transcript_10141/g.13190  ORF Transcript_10141/g.13190 Transcript_10141/m.13190 type:complete len:496 (+) Transcript_10141:114-1601(+)